MPAAVVPASGLASAVVYYAQQRQRKRGRAGRVIAGAESRTATHACVIDLARMAVTASRGQDECQSPRPTAEVDHKIRAGQ